MYQKIIDHINETKVRLFVFYFLAYLLIVFVLNIITPDSLDILQNSNSLLNLIAIPSCLSYYLRSRNKNVYIFMLIYISVFIENAYIHMINYDAKIILFLFIYRTFLLALIIKDENIIVKFLIKHQFLVLLISSILNIIIIPINIAFFSNFTDSTNDNILKVLVISSYYIVFRLAYKVVRKKDFIENVLIVGILLMGIRLYLQFVISKKSFIFTCIPGDSILFFMTFSSILIGIFVEVVFTTNENKKLNAEREMIANDIEKLKDIEDLRMHFFANLSHELKTPINIMYSGIQLLEMNMDKENFNDTYNKYEPILKQNCFRMIRLTNNLVDMTKINEGYMDLNFRNIDIVRLVEEITMSVVQYVENKNINIIFDTLIEEHIVKCNVDAIERIVLNLLSNAIKFSNNNGNILVFMELIEEYIVIRIKDDGIGIPKNDREHVFDLFVQSDKTLTRKKEGSGIGLSLVKSLVKLHNGEVYLEDVEVGTEIVIKIPDVKNEEEFKKATHLNNSQYDCVSKINIEFSDIYDIK